MALFVFDPRCTKMNYGPSEFQFRDAEMTKPPRDLRTLFPPPLTSDQTGVLQILQDGAETADLPDWMIEDCLALGILEEGRPGFYQITNIGRAALEVELTRK
jgi:hypothetical protein